MLENVLGFLSTEWVIDAVIDSIKTIPFLFLVFLFIELFEHFWADKIRTFLRHSSKLGPIAGAGAASIPQCGFSVVASTLYTEGFITRGTIIAVYLATSDEALPVLLMYPEYLSYVIPLIFIKLIIAIPCGYLVDFIIRKKDDLKNDADANCVEGCCRHGITVRRKRDFLIHPIKHTFNIFFFILFLTLVLNYLIEVLDILNLINTKSLLITPFITSIVGLIPNCAVSAGLVILFAKGAITFGALISGLMTSCGIGLLVLFKNGKNKKDIFLILAILVLVGYLTGLLVQSLPF